MRASTSEKIRPFADNERAGEKTLEKQPVSSEKKSMKHAGKGSDVSRGETVLHAEKKGGAAGRKGGRSLHLSPSWGAECDFGFLRKEVGKKTKKTQPLWEKKTRATNRTRQGQGETKISDHPFDQQTGRSVGKGRGGLRLGFILLTKKRSSANSSAPS